MATELTTDLQAHRDWLLSLVPIPGAGVWVDLGCGTGTDALTLASRHSQPELHIVGLDANAKSIEAAAAGGADSRLSFRHHLLGAELPFEAASVEVLYSHNLVECLADRDAFARELARVLKPGGWIVMAHWDWDSQFFDSHDKALVRRLVHAFADWKQPWMDHADGWMGRRLWGTFNAAGLFNGKIHTHTLTNTLYAPIWYGHARVQDFRALVQRGLVTKEDYERFVAEQESLNAEGRYFYSITGFAYVGQLQGA